MDKKYDKIERTIRTYFSGQFNRDVHERFRWWMLNNTDQEQTEKAMESVWDGLSEKAGHDTYEDLDEVHRQIDSFSKRHLMSRVIRIAAGLLVLVMACSAVYLLSRKSYEKELANVDYIHVSTFDGKMKKFYLPDGTFVTLNRGSLLVYPQNFLSGKRNVFLTGQAHFKVKHIPGHSFTVTSENIHVEDIGTVFSLSSYPDNDMVTAIVQEGSVYARVIQGNIEKEYHMTKGKRLDLDRASGRVILGNVNADEENSWSSGRMDFKGESMDEITTILGRRFGVRFVCYQPQLFNGAYYVHFAEDESLDDILRVLSKVSVPFRYNKQGRTVYISPIRNR